MSVGSDDLVEVLSEVQPIIEQRYRGALSGVSHRFDVDDLYQSVCWRAYRNHERCQAQSAAECRNWILKIAANVFRSAIATHRLSGKRSTMRERAIVATSGDLPYVEPWCEQSSELVHGEACRHMLACLDRLPPQRQAVLRMRFLEQRSYQQIAEELGVTIAAARTSVCQAVRQARAELGQYSLPGFEE